MGYSFLNWKAKLQGSTQSGKLFGTEGPRAQLLHRAEGDAVGLAQGAINGARFGHAKFGVVEDKRRNITRVRVAVTHEAAAFGRLEDGGFEDPEILFGAAEGQDGFGVDADAMVSFGDPK
jgi:hypothetical protein